MNVSTKAVLVLDVGATHVRSAVHVDGVIRNLEKAHWPVPDQFDLDLDFIGQVAGQSLLGFEARLGPIVVALAALVGDDGRVERWPNRPHWDGREVRKTLGEILGGPVRIIDDGDAALLGEAHFGMGRGWSGFAHIVVGTGVGGGLWLEGKLLRSGARWAGELGHWVVDEGGPPCSCGKQGCLQAIASGRVLDEYARARGLAMGEMLAAAEAGEPWALKPIEASGAAIGRLAANLTSLLGLQGAVLGGTISDHSRWWGAVQVGWASILAGRRDDARLHRSSLGDQAALLGAASVGAGAP